MAFDNVDIIRPAMCFDEVISTYGYPLIGKNVGRKIYYARRLNGNAKFNRNRLMGKRNPKDKSDKSMFDNKKWLPLCQKTPFLISDFCCNKMKKEPIHNYERKNNLKSFVASLTEESMMRRAEWIRTGCNAFNSTNQISKPLSFWTEQDILTYIVKYDLPIASVYGDIVSVHDSVELPAKDITGQIGCNLKCTGCSRTGCIFCGFGFHLEKKGETRFQRLAKTHPRQYEYSIGGGQWVDNPYYDATAPEYDGEWKNWNPKKIWVPSKKGLGMGKVFDMANEIYGKDFYRYE